MGPSNRIYICSVFDGLWIKSRTAVVVHELAHSVGGPDKSSSSIRHFARELPFPNGTPDESPRDYSHLLPEEAIRNAGSYGSFAIHAAFGFENR